MSVLTTRNLSLQIGSRCLLQDLNWQVERGQCWCVLGANGAGKSSLLRTLAGMQKLQRGELLLAGRALDDWPLLELARQRAYLAQQRQDAFGYSVLETVLAARHPWQAQDAWTMLSAQAWDSEQDLHLVHHALQQVEVAHLAQRDVRSLSGGERQRVALAALLVQDTPLLLLDEPTTALDLPHQAQVMHLLGGLCQAREPKTVVMVLHDLHWAQQLATHVLLLFGDGRWLAGGKEEMMQAEHLSAALHHPLCRLQAEGHVWFVPLEHGKGVP